MYTLLGYVDKMNINNVKKRWQYELLANLVWVKASSIKTYFYRNKLSLENRDHIVEYLYDKLNNEHKKRI